MNKTRHILLILVGGLLFGGLLALHLALPDKEISDTERRLLAQAPEFSTKAVFSGDYMEDLEEYLLDQFPGRESFRTAKAEFSTSILRMQDTNGLYEYKDKLYKIEQTDKGQLAYARKKYEDIYAAYLKDTETRVYYSIVPDKAYPLKGAAGRPGLAYDLIQDTMRDIDGMEYISILDIPTAEDYYDTDTHWRQEAIYPVAQALVEGMGRGSLPAEDSYTAHTLSPFKGVYLGQSALSLEGEELTYLTTPGMEQTTVTSLESGPMDMYTVDKFQGTDGYDVFLGGAQALITLENPNASTDRELVIFRDSFGSSIAPYFADVYAKVTLVDLRYLASARLGEHVTFTDQDVLFLHSTSILNSGRLLK